MAIPGSVLLKILRGREHLDCHVKESSRFFYQRTTPLTVDVDFTVTPPVNKLSVEVPVPPRLSVILGDCLQNTRSALDYLTWELVLAAKKKPSSRNAFPICGGAEEFKRSIENGRLDGLPAPAIMRIEELQPYSDGPDFRTHPLWILDKLCNINKHRRILLTRTKAGYASTVVGADRPTKISEDLAQVTSSRGVVSLTAFVALEEPDISVSAEASSILRQIIDAVERVLPNFDVFFC